MDFIFYCHFFIFSMFSRLLVLRCFEKAKRNSYAESQKVEIKDKERVQKSLRL